MNIFTKNIYLNKALKDTIPIMAGFIFLSFSFSLVMKAKGFPIWCPILMSAIVYSGSLEFASISLLSTSFNPIACFFFGLFFSVRHIFYGIPMLKKYQDTGKIKPILIFGLVDENFSLFTTKDEDISYYFYVSVLCYSYWNLGTILGALLGQLITVDLKGLDFALTALFIVMFMENIKSKNGKISGVIGIVASFISLLFFGKTNMIITSIILILGTLILIRRVLENE